MQIAHSWLKELLPHTPPPAELVKLLTAAGLKVERVKPTGCSIPKVVVARILESVQHPNADRLSVCQVDDGSGQARQIVCGAKNYKAGDKVPLALPGAELPGGVKIRSGKLRGEVSDGMLCSGKELGLDDDAQGLLILQTEASPGTPLAELFPPDTLIELEITPNRGDWLSAHGLAREVAAFLGVALPPRPAEPAAEQHRDAARARVEAAQCLFYSVRRIEGVRVGPSPSWLRNKLLAAGLRPINNVVDITNFVMLEMGQPLHAFDAGKLQGGLCARRARTDEQFATLDGRHLTLCEDDLVIADQRGPVALAGVIGGSESAVSENTTEVWLESALFDPPCVRRMARRHEAATDSSHRFERGVDPQGVLAASERAATLIAELAGGRPAECVWVDGTLPTPAPPVTLRHERCRRLLGRDFSGEEICSLLERIGLTCDTRQPGLSVWRAPSWRRDLEREVDLIEEVARLAGIASIPPKLSAFPAPLSTADGLHDACSSLRQRLGAWGFFEAKSSALASPKTLERFGMLPPDTVRLKNPLGEETSLLRPSLVPGLMRALETNLRHGRKDVKLYEIGAIYSTRQPEERHVLALLATGSWHPPDWRLPAPPMASLGLVRGVLESLFGKLTLRRTLPPGCITGAEVFCHRKNAGWLGLIKPSLARELDLPQGCDVVVGELLLEAVLPASQEKRIFQPLPRFPAVQRDVAMLVDDTVPFSALEEAMEGLQEPLLTAWRMFDEFRDPQGQRAPAGKKSWAVALTFQSPERTLESCEVDAAVERLRAHLSDRLGAAFRM